MLKDNSILRAEARAALGDKWVMAAVAALVYSLVYGAASTLVLGAFLVGFPVTYGFSIVMLHVLRGREIDLGTLFDAFQDYGRILVTKLLQFIYTFLWTLLFIVPGVIKSYSYAMTDFILKDNPALCNDAVIDKSMQMMEGNKMKLFLLDLSFIGWGILALLFTFGIGFFFLRPYMVAAHAAFYEDLKAQQTVVVE